jgi:hypothetical protein
MALTQVQAGMVGTLTPTNLDTQAQYTGFKNRIINGAMTISQYNGTSAVTPSENSYVIDRWRYVASQASKFTIQQNAGSVTPPVGFANYLGLTVASAVSIGSSDYFELQQRIEGFNTADLNWGTANASTVTLSFWVRSSLTGTFGGTLKNSAGNRSYPFTYTINSANTWEYETITIAGDTTGTWLTNNGIGVVLTLGLGVGSTLSGTAGAWAGTEYDSATGATSVVGTNGATFYITGVQLEKGSTATSFDYRPYGTELALCQRYFYKNAPFSLADAGLGNGGQTNTTNSVIYMYLPVSMRAAPTLAQSNTIVSDNNTFDSTVTSIDAGYFTSSSGYANLGHAAYGAAYRPAFFRAKTTGSIGFVSFSAEL